MKNVSLMALAAVSLLTMTAPALADWDRIGSVDVNFRNDRDVKNFDFGGPVERLQLRAEDSNVACRSVNATFANGNTRQIFSGQLREGRATDIDLPGDARTIKRLAFNCGAAERRGATIRILADVGQYREAWRSSPDWARNWSRVFNWGSETVNNWQFLADERFEGRRDSEQVSAGWEGRNVTAVALKPNGADAQCGRVTARFGNGQQQNLNINNGDILTAGRYYKLDLPGDRRNLRSLTMRCHAVNARNVTMQIYTSK